MSANTQERAASTITINGVTFKTSGNIVFQDGEENAYYLAEPSKLDQLEGMLEHGMQMLLKKVKF
ncbi:MAG: hypothetical protein JW782_05155 [Candidatus Saganbacteria bacterium]|nr:hypothetical protein [Candidatus Saganbacteria bacterium]